LLDERVGFLGKLPDMQSLVSIERIVHTNPDPQMLRVRNLAATGLGSVSTCL
jgi:hypothetical protein